ncbi:MAG: methyltransferase [Candidatus Methylomirabilales bacterium]
MPEKELSPEAIFETLTAYQKAAALHAAIQLDLFSGIAEGATTVPALAKRCGTSERGMRSLCDYLVVQQFLSKGEGGYTLSDQAAMFLDRRSPAYMGSVSTFLLSAHLRRAFEDVAAAVRQGGTVLEEQGMLAAQNPAWVEFARGMAPVAKPQADAIAHLFESRNLVPGRVLDVAAGHGSYGIALGSRWPEAEVVFQDWANVLAVAEENARGAGLAERYRTLAGDAFTVDLGGPYDTILVTNFLHHFDVPTCVRFLRRVRGALSDEGRVVTVEFVVDADRVSPPRAAAFSLVMLVSTPAGDAFTRVELEEMFQKAGFSHSEIHPLEGSFQHAIISYP